MMRRMSRRVALLLVTASLLSCAATSGRDVEYLVRHLDGGPALAVDGRDVFWLEESRGDHPPQIRQVAKTGGTPVVRASLVESYRMLAHGGGPKMALVDEGVVYATGDTKSCEARAPCPMSLMLLPRDRSAAPRVLESGANLRWIAGPGGVWVAGPTRGWTAPPTSFHKAGTTTSVTVPALPKPLPPPPSDRPREVRASPAEGEEDQVWVLKTSLVDTTAIRLLFAAAEGEGDDVVTVEAPLDGRAPTVRQHRLDAPVTACVFAGADAYCLRHRGVIKVGEKVTRVAPDADARPSGRLACDASSVYFLGQSESFLGFGGTYGVYRVPRAGGRVDLVAEVPDAEHRAPYDVAHALVVDEDSVYLLTEYELLRVPK
jgi:hypothetical protein